jgi:subtilisin
VMSYESKATNPKKIGSGIRVAVLDSGVNAHHSHVQPIAGGVRFTCLEDGSIACDNDVRDLIGHGTAVAGVIRAKAPGADLYGVRVFDRELRTYASVVAEAIGWAIEHEMKLVNISLGTEQDKHRDLLQRACNQAAERGLILVAAADPDEEVWFPASLDGVIAVAGDDRCAWDEHMHCPDDPIAFRAHPSPRPLPGRPQRFNLRGHSFAAAHITGRIADLLRTTPGARHEEVIEFLIAEADAVPQPADRLHV